MDIKKMKGDNKNKKEYRACYYGKIVVCEEYLNDKKTGEGKIYYVGDGGFSMRVDGIEGGELTYEGGILDLTKNGKGKEYINGKLMYEGDFSDDKRNGKGKEYGKTIFEGEYLKGKKWNGIGYDESGAKF